MYSEAHYGVCVRPRLIQKAHNMLLDRTTAQKVIVSVGKAFTHAKHH